MATIDSKDIIRDLLLNNGKYQDDPQAYSVWSYRNQFGNMTQAVFWKQENDMLESPFVLSPQLLWSRRFGLTPQGRVWLSDQEVSTDQEVSK